jgi:hypothetical protein
MAVRGQIVVHELVVARDHGQFGLCGNPAGADNSIRAGQAACLYS